MKEEELNEETGEVVEETAVQPYQAIPQDLAQYQGMSARAFSKEQNDKLSGGINKDDVEIDPQGLIYLPQVKYRRILRDAFGAGAWAIRPIDVKIDGNVVMFIGELWVEGRFVAWSTGEQRYIPSNERMTYASAVEAAKSDCVTRCCKDLGIASELWDPRFIKKWKAEYAIQVWTEKDGKKKVRWRRKDDPKFSDPYKETGIVQGDETDEGRDSPDVR